MIDLMAKQFCKFGRNELIEIVKKNSSFVNKGFLLSAPTALYLQAANNAFHSRFKALFVQSLQPEAPVSTNSLVVTN